MPYVLEAARVLRPGRALLFAVNRGWKNDQTGNWMPVYRAVRAAVQTLHPHFTDAFEIDDGRIYSDEGIRELLAHTGCFDMNTLSIEIATPRALLTPDRVAAIYNRMYVFGSLPERDVVLDAALRCAQELAQDGLVEIEIPFRIVSVKRARRLVAIK